MQPESYMLLNFDIRLGNAMYIIGSIGVVCSIYYTLGLTIIRVVPVKIYVPFL